MNKSWKLWVAALGSAALMAACGGGSDGGDSLFGGGAGTSSATSLIIALDKNSVANTGSDAVTATVTAIDANNNVVSGAAVLVAADANGVVAASGPTSGTDGKVTATVSIGADRSNRTVTVTASSGGITTSAAFQVIGAGLTSTLVPAVVAPSATAQVQYRLADQSGNAMVGQPISIVAAGLTPAEATGVTGANGEYVFTYTAPAATGSYTIAAQAGGDGDSQTVQVQTTSTVPPVTATIASSSVSANPSVVGVNTAASPTTNRTEIRALFLGANNLPIPNVRVRFDLAGDANSIGGSFTTGTSLVYSDANGVALTAYTPGTRSSPTDGVTVRACYSATDFAAGTCPNSATETLTVTAEPLGVSIGTNETIISTELTYIKKFVVSVVDSAGRAKADVDLAVSLDLPTFYYGSYSYLTATAPAISGWSQFAVGPCSNEDLNRNGVLESGEDYNGSGRLDPGRSDVSVTLLQSRTNSSGLAELQIEYAKSFASWQSVLITVTASGVLGTEGRATYFRASTWVPTAAITVIDEPAFRLSPYNVPQGSATPGVCN